MTDSEQSRINLVVKKLKAAVDKKLLSGGTEKATELLQEAYEAARHPARLPAPWPEITAYRLAHLQMRKGAQTSWDEVDRLLAEAGESPVLGPAPLVYRLVSLQHLRDQGLSAPDALQRIYEQALTRIHTISDSDQKPVRDEGHLFQSKWVNLLEMAVYFTGLDYYPLEGRAYLPEDLFVNLGLGKSAWYVIDGSENSDIAYPETIARDIFEQRRKALAPCLAMIFNGKSVDAELPDGRRDPEAFTCEQGKIWFARLRPTGRRNQHSDDRSEQSRQRQEKKRFWTRLAKCSLEVERTRFDAWWDRSEFAPPLLDIPVLMLVGPEKSKNCPKKRQRL